MVRVVHVFYKPLRNVRRLHEAFGAVPCLSFTHCFAVKACPLAAVLRALASAKLVVFLVTGAGKREPLDRLLAGADIPAAWVDGADVRVIADRAAHPRSAGD